MSGGIAQVVLRAGQVWVPRDEPKDAQRILRVFNGVYAQPSVEVTYGRQGNGPGFYKTEQEFRRWIWSKRASCAEGTTP